MFPQLRPGKHQDSKENKTNWSPSGLYINCFAIYLDFTLNKHVLLYSARGQQLRDFIPVEIHLNLIKGT